jgi:hypothetical protein
MKTKFLFLISIIAFTLSSCNKDDENEGYDSNSVSGDSGHPIFTGEGWHIDGKDIYYVNDYELGYYKNDNFTRLTNPVHNDIMNDIFVSGNDVYVLATLQQTDALIQYASRAYYWKNGVSTKLSVPSPPALGDGSYGSIEQYELAETFAHRIFVENNDIYVMGYVKWYVRQVGMQGINAGPKVQGYWKNNSFVAINEPVVDGYNVTPDLYEGDIFAANGDAYIVGLVNYIGGGYVNGYWKNQSFISRLNTLHNNESGFGVNHLYVTGSDVYIAGTEQSDASSAETTACYWKNGNRTDLPSNSMSATATGITTSGSDVYVSGTLYDDDDNSYPCYWKNGQLTIISNVSYPGEAYTLDICNAGGDIYILERDGSQLYYWKNGKQYKYPFRVYAP